MPRMLVTGGTGALGSAIVNRLKSTGQPIRLLSRQPAPYGWDTAVEWVQGDIVTGAGLADALAEVDVVINCVGDATNVYATDVAGVKHLAEMAQQAAVRHFFHVSIVGINHISFPYYQHKVEAETAIINSGVPYSIQRVTQFHSLLAWMMTKLQATAEGYVLPMDGDALFQVIDTRDVAEYILPLLLAEPAGYLPDVGGQEILWVEKLARIYLEARGITDPVLLNPAQGLIFTPAAIEAFREGVNTAPDNRYGQILWADYVREHVPAREEQSS